ncbi:hypothetical protein M0804_011667 [Polistes exclamans]|nr:hypothetical protein M0804_011667 [Polistes exclamans]
MESTSGSTSRELSTSREVDMVVEVSGGVVGVVVAAIDVVARVVTELVIRVDAVVGVAVEFGDGMSFDTTAIGDTIIEFKDVVDKTKEDADEVVVAGGGAADGTEEAVGIKVATDDSSVFAGNGDSDGKITDIGAIIIDEAEEEGCIAGVCELLLDALASTKDDSRLRSSSLPNSSSSLV